MQWTNRSRSGRIRVLCAIAVIVVECFLGAVIVADGARSRLTQASQPQCSWLLYSGMTLLRFYPSRIVFPLLQPRTALFWSVAYALDRVPDGDTWSGPRMRRLDLGIVTVYWAR